MLSRHPAPLRPPARQHSPYRWHLVAQKRIQDRESRNQAVRLATIIHAAVVTLKAAHGQPDTRTFADLPEAQRALSLELIEMLTPNPGVTPEYLHKLWLQRMRAAGWSYGDKLDVEQRTHPALRDWRQLDEVDKRKDALVIAIIQALTDPL